jgi:hypothetical protein
MRLKQAKVYELRIFALNDLVAENTSFVFDYNIFETHRLGGSAGENYHLCLLSIVADRIRAYVGQ